MHRADSFPGRGATGEKVPPGWLLTMTHLIAIQGLLGNMCPLSPRSFRQSFIIEPACLPRETKPPTSTSAGRASGLVWGVRYSFLSPGLYTWVQSSFIPTAPRFCSSSEGVLRCPRRGGTGCGCARAAGSVNELWHLKPWKTQRAGGGERCLASRRSDCPEGFAGSPMTSLAGSPDGRAPPRFPPGALSPGLQRTAGGLCPLLCHPRVRKAPRQGSP